MSVHQSIGNIGLSLVQCRVEIGRALHRTGYSADIQYHLFVRTETEFRDSLSHIRQQGPAAQPVSFVHSLVELTALQIINMPSVPAPTRTAYAFAFAGELVYVRTVRIAYKNIAAAAVLGNIRIAYSIQNGLSVRAQLRVRKTSHGQKGLRAQNSVLYVHLLPSYILDRGLLIAISLLHIFA